MKVKAIVIPLRAIYRDMPMENARQIIIEDDRSWCIGDKVWYEGKKARILSLVSDRYDYATISVRREGGSEILHDVLCSMLYRRYGFFELRKVARELKKGLEGKE